MSLDGYVAGPDQSEYNPLGVGAMELHEWLFAPGIRGAHVVGSSSSRRENSGVTRRECGYTR
jgi:hypothetical protein